MPFLEDVSELTIRKVKHRFQHYLILNGAQLLLFNLPGGATY